jgi:hypothetical protein
MLNKPKTQGDLRQLVAEAIYDVRYGHLKKEVLSSMADGLDSINNSLRTEIAVWALHVQLGRATTHELGSLPLNGSKRVEDVE